MSGSRGEANFVWRCKSCKVCKLKHGVPVYVYLLIRSKEGVDCYN